MQRSFSSSSANYPPSRDRFIPIQLISNNKTDSYLQRTSSTSSCCSSISNSSANYRILPVRYSSVDRINEKPAIVTSNKHGINVRIRFERPKHHHHHQNRYEYEHYRKIQMSNSCPVLNKIIPGNSPNLSNINYIETRSIIRGHSSDQLNRSPHSNTFTIRQQSLPPSSSSSRIIQTRIRHIPLDIRSMFKPIITRVIREEKEECFELIVVFLLQKKFYFVCFFLGF